MRADELKENANLSQNSNLERLRELIAAAIDYFIGKRSLDGDVEQAQEINNIQGLSPEILAEKFGAKIQTGSKNSTNRAENFTSESSNPLKIDDQIQRLQKLIEDAIAYFFGKERAKPSLDQTSDITPSQEAWLTMEQVFGDDNGPWPIPLEYESHAFAKSPDMAYSTLQVNSKILKPRPPKSLKIDWKEVFFLVGNLRKNLKKNYCIKSRMLGQIAIALFEHGLKQMRLFWAILIIL